MTNQYRVARSGSIVVGRVLLMPGQEIPNGALSTEQIKRLLSAKAIVRIGAGEPAQQRPTPPPVGIGERSFQKGLDGPEVEQAGGGASAQAARLALAEIQRKQSDSPPPSEAPAAGSPWTHDPDGLVGQPVEDLRQLVRNVDADIEVDSLDEVDLIALLSTDFTPVQPQG